MYNDDDMIKKEIRQELDRQYQKDLAVLMENAAFRRVLCYLFMECGRDDSLPMGNSRDIFNAGRRHVAVQLQHAVDSIGTPNRMSGMMLRHQAEQEYAELEIGIRDHIVGLRKKLEDVRRVTPKDNNKGVGHNGRRHEH